VQHNRNLPIPDTLADVCDPDRMALVVYDMQVGVVSQLADGQQVIGQVSRVLEAARRAGVRIFFTRHMTLPTELMGISQLRTAMAWQRKDRVEDVVSPLLRESPGFEIVPELAPTAADRGLIPVVVTDACGAGNHAAAKRCLDVLATAGDAILTDIATITGLLARPTMRQRGQRGGSGRGRLSMTASMTPSLGSRVGPVVVPATAPI
jgi:biuret amidohydrolase